jgi:transcriptional regulator with XRE-family HTH domain
VVEDFVRQHVKAEVARLLSEERRKRRLSMNMLASKAGLSQSFVSSFESAPVNPVLDKTPWNPTLDSLLRMAKVLEVNLGDILKKAIRNVERDGKRKPVSDS